MRKLQQDLIENKNKRRREKFLSVIDAEFSAILSNAEVSGDVSCIKYAAFPMLDNNANVLTSTRGEVIHWKNFTFKTWHELISLLQKFQKIKNYIGWFFIDADGPYYRISANAFISNIKSIYNYGIAHKHYDFGWVGSVDDVGIIIGHNHTSSTPDKFEVSVWGM